MTATATETKKATPKRGKKRKAPTQSNTYLEKLVSQTRKFKVDDLLELYSIYDTLVVDVVFRHLLFPYTRMARQWLRDQARDLLAGTDRNRLILTSRFRKASDAQWETASDEEKSRWSVNAKPRHMKFMSSLFGLLSKYPNQGHIPTAAEVEGLGVSRLVYDDMGAYFVSLMNSYPMMVADYCAAIADGDHDEAAEINAFMRCLETEVGILRDHAWYVSVNARSVYDQIDKMVQTVTMAYARLLFRFAHRLRGVTSTEENFSAGYEGMIRAARNYDPVDGSSFTAHCQWWVRSAVLQRQRQASVILLPTTTWYQLGLVQKGQTELSTDRISDLKERAEMFYANSSNANHSYDDGDGSSEDMSFESIYVTSPDASVVLGDSVLRAQSVEEGYESQDTSKVGRERLEEGFSLLTNEDPTLVFPLLLWALNSGIDASMLAEVIAQDYLSDEDLRTEKQRHKDIKAKHDKRQNRTP